MERIRKALRTGADEVLFLPVGQGGAACALLKVSGLHKPEHPAFGGQPDG